MPTLVRPVMNFQLSVSKSDFARSVIFALDNRSAHGTAFALNVGSEVRNTLTGIIRPKIPIRRLTIVYG